MDQAGLSKGWIINVFIDYPLTKGGQMRQKISLLTLALILFAALPVFAQLAPPDSLKATEVSSYHGSYVMLEWKYTTTSPSSMVRFKVYKKHIDSTNFVVIATNLRDRRFNDVRTLPGATFQYYVVAYNNSTTSAPSATVSITLAPPPPPPAYGLITGRVVDGNGAPLGGAYVKSFSQTVHYDVSARTDSNGFFKMRVKTGSYFLWTSKPGYFGEYYDNVNSLANATPVVVAEGDSLVLAIDLASFVPPATYTLTGTVTNDQGAAQRAEVYVYKVGGGNYHWMVRRTFTDSLGHYSVPVKQNDTVIVYAKTQGFVYYPEFYNNKRTIAEADRIGITGNVTGIDFVMDPLPVYANGITGLIADTTGAPVMGYVSAYRVDNTSFGKKMYSVHTDSFGVYTFANLVPGKYVLFAKPQGTFFPTWFRYDGAQAWRRIQADSVMVDNQTVVNGINFTVRARPDSGFAWISGAVSAGLGEAGAESFVYAINDMNEVVGFAMTDRNGRFVIDGMYPGQYTVVPDRADYTGAVTATAVISAGNYNPFVNVRLQNDSPSDVQDGSVVTGYSLAQNFPNPFNPTTTIRFSVPEAGNVTVKVFNILGKEVGTLVSGFHQAGTYNVVFDASKLASGVYLYQIEAGSFKATKKFTLLK